MTKKTTKNTNTAGPAAKRLTVDQMLFECFQMVTECEAAGFRKAAAACADAKEAAAYSLKADALQALRAGTTKEHFDRLNVDFSIDDLINLTVGAVDFLVKDMPLKADGSMDLQSLRGAVTAWAAAAELWAAAAE